MKKSSKFVFPDVEDEAVKGLSDIVIPLAEPFLVHRSDRTIFTILYRFRWHEFKLNVFLILTCSFNSVFENTNLTLVI